MPLSSNVQNSIPAMQSLFISILSGAGVIKTTDDSKNLQNFLIACEMLPASIFMLWAFPYTDYKSSGTCPPCTLSPAQLHIVASAMHMLINISCSNAQGAEQTPALCIPGKVYRLSMGSGLCCMVSGSVVLAICLCHQAPSFNVS